MIFLEFLKSFGHTIMVMFPSPYVQIFFDLMEKVLNWAK
jgi:hypothetical protein